MLHLRGSVGAALASMVLGAAMLPAVAHTSSRVSAGGWHETVVHAFEGSPDGTGPIVGLIRGPGGVFFGTTQGGGAMGPGTVFELTPTASGFIERVLHNFAGGLNDGALPSGPLTLAPDGTLYGTTTDGGTSQCGYTHGCGVVYALHPQGSTYQIEVLWRFQGLDDGVFPVGGVARDGHGMLFGATCCGGSYATGVVYRLAPGPSGYSLIALHDLGALGDASKPLYGGVVLDSSGTLFGTAEYGGMFNEGAVYAVAPTEASPYRERVVHSFGNTADGRYPGYAPFVDANGRIFGAVYDRVYELQRIPNGEYAYRTIYQFHDGTDGAAPSSSLVEGAHGELYGETLYGGVVGSNGRGQGTVYKLTPAGGGYRETVLYAFSLDGSDGRAPQGGLLLDRGRLFGTAIQGGDSTCNPPYGCGVVFMLTPP